VDIRTLQRRRKELKDKCESMLEKSGAENRGFTPQEEGKWASMFEEMERLTRWIDEWSREHGGEEDANGSRARRLESVAGGGEGRVQGEVWKDAKTGQEIRVLSNDMPIARGLPTDIRADACASRIDDMFEAVLNPAARAKRDALGVGIGTTGGYNVPEGIVAGFIDLARSKSFLSQAGMRVIVMDGPTLRLVRTLRDPEGAWLAEHQDLVKSPDPLFGAIDFTPRKFVCLIPYSNEFVQDAPNGVSVIRDLAVKAVTHELDRAGGYGDGGSNEPRGVMHHPGLQHIPHDGAATYDVFLDGIEKVEVANGAPTSVAYAPATKNALAKLRAGTDDMYLAPPPDWTGLRRFTTNKLSEGDALLGDFSQIIMAVRLGLELEVSRDAGEFFGKDQSVLKVRWRGDFGVAHADHLCKITGLQ